MQVFVVKLKVCRAHSQVERVDNCIPIKIWYRNLGFFYFLFLWNLGVKLVRESEGPKYLLLSFHIFILWNFPIHIIEKDKRF